MLENHISLNIIPCGKYKNLKIAQMLRDRPYCKWFLSVSDFEKTYPHIYQAVKDFKPQTYFVYEKAPSGSFVADYPYFNLIEPSEVKIELSADERTCYEFYYNFLKGLRTTIEERLTLGHAPITAYNISSPKKWLIDFESSTGLSRDVLKEFMAAYELPNAAHLITDIKAQAGIEYKGAQTFNIARANSKKQELFWQEVLTEKYGIDICCQFNFQKVYDDVALETCIFDFINIKAKRVFEAKLGFKDFNKKQYEKYLSSLGSSYKFLFLIDNDCVYDVSGAKMYVLDAAKYKSAVVAMCRKKEMNDLERMACAADIIEVRNMENYL